ncbi:unannotated protein [freshwater metagenome]|uniref:Unannotated protein n=1 Tax=freshwater metagenome TaxID=449393 RepID=A0A6J7AUF9_9ZZZZ
MPAKSEGQTARAGRKVVHIEALPVPGGRHGREQPQDPGSGIVDDQSASERDERSGDRRVVAGARTPGEQSRMHVRRPARRGAAGAQDPLDPFEREHVAIGEIGTRSAHGRHGVEPAWRLDRHGARRGIRCPFSVDVDVDLRLVLDIDVPIEVEDEARRERLQVVGGVGLTARPQGRREYGERPRRSPSGGRRYARSLTRTCALDPVRGLDHDPQHIIDKRMVVRCVPVGSDRVEHGEVALDRSRFAPEPAVEFELVAALAQDRRDELPQPDRRQGAHHGCFVGDTPIGLASERDREAAGARRADAAKRRNVAIADPPIGKLDACCARGVRLPATRHLTRASQHGDAFGSVAARYIGIQEHAHAGAMGYGHEERRRGEPERAAHRLEGTIDCTAGDRVDQRIARCIGDRPPSSRFVEKQNGSFVDDDVGVLVTNRRDRPDAQRVRRANRKERHKGYGRLVLDLEHHCVATSTACSHGVGTRDRLAARNLAHRLDDRRQRHEPLTHRGLARRAVPSVLGPDRPVERPRRARRMHSTRGVHRGHRAR